VDELRSALQSSTPALLDRFLGDLLTARPADAAAYLNQWAQWAARDGTCTPQNLAGGSTRLLQTLAYAVGHRRGLDTVLAIQKDMEARRPVEPMAYLRLWAQYKRPPPDADPAVAVALKGRASHPQSPQSPQSMQGIHGAIPMDNGALTAPDIMARLIDDFLLHQPLEFWEFLKKWASAEVAPGAQMAISVKGDVARDIIGKPITAMVVDCGVGETRVVLYSYSHRAISIVDLPPIHPMQHYLDEPTRMVEIIGSLAARHQASTTLVTASQWMRTVEGETMRKTNELLTKLMEAGVATKVLEQNYEAWMEATAIQYFSSKMGLKFTAAWAAGSVTTQLCAKFEKVSGLNLGSAEGARLINRHGPTEGVQRWRAKIQETVQGFRKLTSVRLTGRICAVAGVSFAAVDAEIPLAKFLPVSGVRQMFADAIERLQGDVARGEKAHVLSNLVLQASVLAELVVGEAEIYFARDVVLDGQNFRLAWSSGYFIYVLAEMGALDVQQCTALQCLQHETSLDGKVRFLHDFTGARRLRGFWGPERILDLLTEEVQAVEQAVSPGLQRVAEQQGGRLGALERAIMDRETIQRKLADRLTGLLACHKYEPFFVPRLEELVSPLTDVLRYTLVCKPDHYAATVKACVLELQRLHVTNVRCENYWTTGSVHFGVTIWGTKAVPRLDPFVFEVHVHTEYSYRVSTGDAKKLMEVFQSLQPSEAKKHLYQALKTLWLESEIPRGLSQAIAPQMQTDTFMEHFIHATIYKDWFLHNHSALVESQQADMAGFDPSVCQGLCARLMHGSPFKGEEQFTRLSFPHNERVAWFQGSESLEAFAQYQTEDVPKLVGEFLGKSPKWVKFNVINGDYWRLLVLPQDLCRPADWKGLLSIVMEEYPEVAPIIIRFTKPLAETPFDTIEEELGGLTFRDIKDGSTDDPMYMTLNRLRALPNIQLWHVRGFLYNEVGARELFRGDGYAYDYDGVKRGREYLCSNKLISEVAGSVLLPKFNYVPTEIYSPKSRSSRHLNRMTFSEALEQQQ